ncbi:serine hydrolase [Chryseolinea sp. H1M3-3]|uniref:serine hydrolase n=1 Tax=Chryseolinea sp. H1M3-3 TaxID=3034144 RepID=UPI0023ED6E11|nr:serine hydrolase [Chryseolinea sp. H1M3-3]
MLKKVFVYILMICGISGQSLAQPDKNAWVDSVFNSLSIDEKIGQLFMVPVPSRVSKAAIEKIESQIKSKEVGGVVFDSLGPVQQANITNRLQHVSQIPLLIAQAAPVGIGQRRDSTIHFPDAYIIGASRNDSAAYFTGREIARKMRLLGAHMNISPFATVAESFRDSLSHYSFGQDNKRVASRSVAFMKGLQDHGMLAVVKNFTVNGATVLDVKEDFPVMQLSVDTSKTLSFYNLFENKIAGVMTAPAKFPLFYQDKNLVRKNEFDAPTISLLFSGDWLEKETNYQGLTLIDLSAKEEGDEKSKGNDALLAFQTGNDLLISSEDVGPAIRKIKRLIKKEERYETLLTKSVRKILAAKYDAGLWRTTTLTTDNLLAKLNSSEAQVMSQKLYEAGVTVIQDQQQVVPISTLENKRFVYINTTARKSGEFYQYILKYVHPDYFPLSENSNVDSLFDAFKKQQHTIIIGVFPETSAGVIQKIKAEIQRYSSAHEIILCDFGNESFLQENIPNVTIITAYAAVSETLRAIPQVIFGGLKANGVLPYTFSASAAAGTGLETETLRRLTYSLPEDAAMSSKTLEKIKNIVDEAITTHATPGCQILVARKGKVIYDKSFGGLTYEPADSVKEENIYDLASLTKVSATLQTVMFMYEKGLIDLNKKLSYYLPELKNTNKKDITLVEMLTHQAGLVPFIPMWTQTVKDNVFLPQYYSRVQSDVYPLQVSPDLYAAPLLRDSVWSWIGESKLQNKPPRTPYSYQYSDLGFLLLQRLAERIFNQPIDEFLAQNLYEPLGAYTTGFTPLKRFPAQQIAPTEDDKIYRKTHIAGTVHDERAAMMGGVAGHAGLFSNATDLAKLGQMLLQEGSYGGYQYYKPETVNLFTAKQFDKSRRGLGWDKPVQSEWNSPTSLKASPSTFGHTGFTGTCIWIDPEFDLVYIFLSNRVYPDRSGKLITSNIRSRIQDVVYESIFDYCKYDY